MNGIILWAYFKSSVFFSLNVLQFLWYIEFFGLIGPLYCNFTFFKKLITVHFFGFYYSRVISYPCWGNRIWKSILVYLFLMVSLNLKKVLKKTLLNTSESDRGVDIQNIKRTHKTQ